MDKIEAYILERIRQKGEYTNLDHDITELLDSFEYVELMVDIQETFNLKLDLSKYANLMSVNGIIQQIKALS